MNIVAHPMDIPDLTPVLFAGAPAWLFWICFATCVVSFKFLIITSLLGYDIYYFWLLQGHSDRSYIFSLYPHVHFIGYARKRTLGLQPPKGLFLLYLVFGVILSLETSGEYISRFSFDKSSCCRLYFITKKSCKPLFAFFHW